MCAKCQITTVSVAAVVKTSNDIIAGNGSCFKNPNTRLVTFQNLHLNTGQV